MASQTPVKLIFGAAGLAPDAETGSISHVVERLDVLESLGVKNIDTAALYGPSEDTLGKAEAGKRFIIDTKHLGGFEKGSATPENIVKHGLAAKKLLEQVDVYFLHAPDDTLPLESQLEGIQKLYETGAFKRFGLSNYKPEDIQKVYDITKEKGWVLPTVFQGNYNPVARSQETETFPLLRKLGIAFYAYSPLAGGFLAKTKQQVENAKGRWEPGTMLGNIYRGLYGKQELLNALDDWQEIAKKEGVTGAELGYRWVRYHSSLKSEYGDGLIFGAYSNEQITQTVNWLNSGPLSEEATSAIDKIWEKIKHVAPTDNFNDWVNKK